MIRPWAALALGLMLAGCAREKPIGGPVEPARSENLPSGTLSMLQSQFETHKAQWEGVMRGSDSPLPAGTVESFPGLSFYPYDSSWRFVGDLERLPTPRVLDLPATRGKVSANLEYGRIPIAIRDTVVTLTVYRPVEHSNQYWTAFTDSTTGGETYGGGRYVHLDSLDTHKFILDFNKAYNPYCAYDTTYICPLPPPGNRIPFAVRAGMRDVAH